MLLRVLYLYIQVKTSLGESALSPLYLYIQVKTSLGESALSPLYLYTQVKTSLGESALSPQVVVSTNYSETNLDKLEEELQESIRSVSNFVSIIIHVFMELLPCIMICDGAIIL